MASILDNKDVKTEALSLGVKAVTGITPVIVRYQDYNTISFTPAHAAIIERLVTKGLDSQGKPSNVRIDYNSLINAGTVAAGAKLLWPYLLAIGALGYVAGVYMTKRSRKHAAT